MPIIRAPSVALSRLPTPLEAAPRLAAAIGLSQLWVKREDLSGYALGGNKLRQIDLILADALSSRADTVITSAGVQSNFCRTLSAAAAKLGLRCILLLRGDAASPMTGNLLLDRLFGAELRFVPMLDPWSNEIRTRLAAVADEVRASGHVPYVAHLPGHTATLATAGWVAGAQELDGQLRESGAEPRAIVVAAGSGLTAAGLALGFAQLGRQCRVHAVSVQQPATRLRDWILDVTDRVRTEMDLSTAIDPKHLLVDDSTIGAGYGVPTPEGLAAATLAARTEALVLDPIYTGKAMAGLIAAIRDGDLSRGDSAVFLHSGGTPGLFAQSSDIASYLRTA